jgi:hypothetical protein
MTDAISAAIATERNDRRDEIAKEIGELRSALKVLGGKLPIAKVWAPETVAYQGSLVVHDGACWQALQDTAQCPGGSDWVSVARAGRDGRDGASLSLRGPYDVKNTMSVSMLSSLAATPSSPGATAQAFVRARIGCHSPCAAPKATRARLARAAPKATEDHPARRSPSGGSTVNASSSSRSSPMERLGRRYACATCSKNS